MSKWIDRSLYKSLIRKIWGDYLLETRSQHNFEGYRVSGIGSCFLKQLYAEEDNWGNEDPDLQLKLNVGTLLHASREMALRKKKKELFELCKERHGKDVVAFHQEITISDPDLGIVGHPDMVFEYKDFFDILDDKYVHHYYWSKLFGFKKNRDPEAGESYKQQIIQYAMILEKLLGKPLRKAILLVGKKEDLFQREIVVSRAQYEPLCNQYWKELAAVKEERKEIGVIPGVRYGCPFHSWECTNCKYRTQCYPGDKP